MAEISLKLSVFYFLLLGYGNIKLRRNRRNPAQKLPYRLLLPRLLLRNKIQNINRLLLLLHILLYKEMRLHHLILFLLLLPNIPNLIILRRLKPQNLLNIALIQPLQLKRLLQRDFRLDFLGQMLVHIKKHISQNLRVFTVQLILFLLDLLVLYLFGYLEFRLRSYVLGGEVGLESFLEYVQSLFHIGFVVLDDFAQKRLSFQHCSEGFFLFEDHEHAGGADAAHGDGKLGSWEFHLSHGLAFSFAIKLHLILDGLHLFTSVQDIFKGIHGSEDLAFS